MRGTARRFRALGGVALVLGAWGVLAGCSTDTKLTPQEAANIKGTGKMPPEAQAMMAKKMAESKARIGQGTRPGAPSGAPGQTGTGR